MGFWLNECDVGSGRYLYTNATLITFNGYSVVKLRFIRFLTPVSEPVRQNLELANSRMRETYQVQRGNGMMAERMSTDIAALKNQYMSIRSRQLRAHLVYTKPGEY